MKKLLKIGAIVVAVLILLLVAAFLYVNNGAFVKRHVLPRVADAFGAPVTAGDVEFSVFGHLTLTDLQVGQPTDPLLTARHARVQYQLWPALRSGGRVLRVDEVSLTEATINYRPDKIPPRPVKEDDADADDDAKAKGPAPDLRITNVRFTSVSIHAELPDEDGYTRHIRINDVDVKLPLLANGEDFSVSLSTAISAEANRMTTGAIAVHGTIGGHLDAELRPTHLHGDIRMVGADGSMFSDRSAQLAWDVKQPDALTMTIEKFALTQTFGQRSEAEMAMTGDIRFRARADGGRDLEQAALKLSAKTLSPTPLMIVTTLTGYNLGSTTLAYDGALSYAAGADADAPPTVSSTGALEVTDLTVSNPAVGLKPLEPLTIRAAHDLSFVPAPPAADGSPRRGTAKLNTFTLQIADASGHPLATGALDQPMLIDLDQPGADQSRSASLTLQLLDLPLSLIAPMLPPAGPRLNSGVLAGSAGLQVTGTGALIALTVDIAARDLSVTAAEKTFTGLTFNQKVEAVVQDLNQVSIQTISTSLFSKAGPVATASITGTLTREPQAGQLAITADLFGANAQSIIDELLPDLNVGQSRGHYEGTLSIDGGTLRHSGSFAGDPLTVIDRSKQTPEVTGMTLSVKHGGDFRPTDRTGTLDTLTAALSDAQGHKLVTLDLRHPANLDLNVKNAISGDVDLKVHSEQFPLELLAPFLPPDLPVTLKDGHLDVDMDITASPDGKSVLVRGSVSTADLRLTKGDAALPTLRLEKSWDIAITNEGRSNDREIDIRSVQAKVYIVDAAATAPQLVGELTHSGNLRLGATPSATMKTKGAVHLQAAQPLLAAFLGEISFNDRDIIVEADTSLDGFGMKNAGAIAVKDLVVTRAGQPANPPLSLHTNWTLGFSTSTKTLNLAEWSLTLLSQDSELLSAKLDEAFTLPKADPAAPAAGPPTLPRISARSTDLNLATLAAFLPPDGTIRGLAGTLNLQAQVSQSDAGQPQVAIDTRVDGLRVTGPDGPTLTEPLALRLVAKAGVDADGMLRIPAASPVTVNASSPNATLLDLRLHGDVDTTDQARPSRLVLSSQQVIALDQLLALMPPAREDDGDPEAETAEASAQAQAPPRPMDLSVDVSLVGVSYKQMKISDIRLPLTLKNQVAGIDALTFKVNDTGSGRFVVRADQSKPELPAYDIRGELTGIAVQPLLDSFKPDAAVELRGGLKTLTVNLAGAGADSAALKQNLRGQISSQLDAIQIARIKGKIGEYLVPIIEANYGLKVSDLSFDRGDVLLDVADGRVFIRKVDAAGPMVRLKSAADYVSLVSAEPDYTVVLEPEIAKAAERQMPSWAAKSLTPLPDGWYRAEPWTLTPKSLSVEALAKKLAVDAATGQLKDKLGEDLGGAAGKILGGDVEGGIGEALGGLLGGDKKKDEKKDADTTQPPKKDEEKKDPLKRIEGLFK